MTGYGAPQPQQSQRSGEQLPLFHLIGALLGILAFIWGFLKWAGQSDQGVTVSAKGYNSGLGTGAIGLSILAGAVAATVLLDRKGKDSLVPLGASIAALLVTIGLLVGQPSGVNAKIGVWLMLITAVLQVLVFLAAWLQSEGKIMAGSSGGGGGAGAQWGGSQQQQQWGGYQQHPQQQQGYPQQVPGQTYGQPGQPQYGAQPQPHQQPAQPQYGQTPPPQHQPQHQPPQQNYPQQPPSNPYGQS